MGLGNFKFYSVTKERFEDHDVYGGSVMVLSEEGYDSMDEVLSVAQNQGLIDRVEAIVVVVWTTVKRQRRVTE